MRRASFTFLLTIAAFCMGMRAHAAGCALSSVPAVEFGGFSGSSIRVTGTITFQCDQGTAYSIALGQGSGSSASTGSRSMSGGADSLAYQLYSDAGYNIVWGNTPAVNTVNGTATGATQTAILYALLPMGQYAAAGTYMDSVMATITANAMPQSMTLAVRATVLKACTVTATPMAFGNYFGQAISSVSTVSATCTRDTTYSIGLDNGTTGGSAVRRAMTGPSQFQLSYNLYTDAGHTVAWGNTPGVNTVASSGSGMAQPFPVYGMVEGGQTAAPAGSYSDSDTITVTLTY